MTPDLKTSEQWRVWLAIAVFVLLPLCMGVAVFALGPPAPVSESVLKWELAARHGKFDTIVVGDSRVMRIGGPEFARRGWNFFNLGTSGDSPEDVAFELRKALLTEPIARVIIGLSFENMAEAYPFEFSRSKNDAPFQDPAILEFVGKAAPPPLLSTRKIDEIFTQLLPIGKGHETGHYLRMKMQGASPPPMYLPDGEAAYVEILENLPAAMRTDLSDPARPERPLAARSRLQSISLQAFFNPPVPARPVIHMDEPESVAAYLKSKRLSPDSKRLFLKIIGDLRARNLPVVMFETGRKDSAQRLIDENPVLRELQKEWRDFFRSQAGGCIRFVEQTSLHDLYQQSDFIDQMHYLGATQGRISARLAEELASEEVQCRNATSIRNGDMK